MVMENLEKSSNFKIKFSSPGKVMELVQFPWLGKVMEFLLCEMKFIVLIG